MGSDSVSLSHTSSAMVFLAKLAVADVTGEHRPHAVCYARRPPPG